MGKVLAGTVVVLFAYSYLFMDLIVAFAGVAVLLYMVYRRLHFNGLLSGFKITVQRELLEKVVHKDSPFSVRVEVLSETPLNVIVKDHIPANFIHREGEMKGSGLIGPGKGLSFLYSLVPTDRGSYPLSGLVMNITEPRGLFLCTITADPGTNVLVQASKKDLVLASLLGRRKRFDITGKADSRQTRTVRSDFKSIRDYIPGDRFRDIDWKATSRLTKLMTKEFETERNIPTMIVMDCSMTMRELVGKHTKMDHAIALAIQAASVLRSQGNPVGLITYDEHRVLAHNSPGKTDLDELMLALFHLPNPTVTGEYPGYSWAQMGETTDEEAAFLGSVGPFLVSGKRPSYDKKRTTGIYEAVRSLRIEEESGMLLVIFTDLESSREALINSLSIAIQSSNRVILISAFSWPYHAASSGLDRTTLELMYEDHAKKQEAIRNLRAAGVKVIEVTPKERGDSVMGRLRSMGQ